MLKNLFALSSFANIAAGVVLFLTWAVNWAADPGRHVPVIVLAIGGSMIIQGLYSAGYSRGWWGAWGDIASGALLAGELISGCVALGMLISGLAYNASSNDSEMAPVLAGLMIGINALLGLIYLFTSGTISLNGAASSARGTRA